MKLRNIHQLKSLGEISYIPLLTLNSVVTKATGKNIRGSHILIRAQCGKVKVIEDRIEFCGKSTLRLCLEAIQKSLAFPSKLVLRCNLIFGRPARV